LLGAGESGKSTLFKQISTIYGEGFTQKQLNQYQPSIHQLIISSIKTLAEQSQALADKHNTAVVDQDLQESIRFVKDIPEDASALDADMAKHIKLLWADPGIKKTYQLRANFQLLDSAAYFFDRLDRCAAEAYEPSYEDVIRCRVRTTGIVETRFEIGGHKFLLVDVGGQRNERKKWIHSFEGVTAVIFVASLSEYDQTLFEDNSVSRIVESLNLFDEVLKMKWFLNHPVLLFLNKRDLFEEKLKSVPLSKMFPDFAGGADYQQAAQYMERKFLERASDERRKQIYSHVVCATDQNNVAHVFNDVKDIIIRGALENSGLGVV
jgi:guanine nucleotide-binding protein G(i) subunit alpha